MTHDLDLGELGPHLTTSPGSPAHHQPCTFAAVRTSDSGGLNLLRIDRGQLVSQSVRARTYSRRGSLSQCTGRPDMPALLRASYVVCRVLCVLCLCLWPLCDPSSRSPGSNPLSDATRGATSPILPSRQAIQACQAIFSIPGGSLAQHRPDRPDGILVASRLSPRRTQSKIRALLCSLGRLLLHSITACVATDT